MNPKIHARIISGTFTPVSGTQTMVLALKPAPAERVNQKAIIQDLMRQMEDIVDNHPFFSWSLMLAGVELLGTCLDKENDFFTENKSSARFSNAIDKLFPAEYKQYKKRLYKELRCGVNHYTFPKPTIVLSERAYGKEHLSFSEQGYLVLVAEDFFEHFKQACEKVIRMVDDGNIQEKFYQQLV